MTPAAVHHCTFEFTSESYGGVAHLKSIFPAYYFKQAMPSATALDRVMLSPDAPITVLHDGRANDGEEQLCTKTTVHGGGFWL